MPVNVRFAPSPTGRLHIGNIRTAVLNWLFAQKNRGEFLLRIDDTDQERSTEEFAEGIRQDLTWLGLKWDRTARQSDRFDRYREVIKQLESTGRLYRCYETPDELDRRRKRQVARDGSQVYDRAGLKLTVAEREKFEAGGRKPHWRFLLKNFKDDPLQRQLTEVVWEDAVRGRQAIDIGSQSDPVLVKADGSFLYTLSSVVDDVDFGISQIIRGEDHVTNTAVQIDIFRALGATPPNFAHHSLLIGKDGQGLSKRLGALSIQSFREDGIEPEAVTSLAATLGTSDPISVHATLASLVAGFDLAKLSRAPGRFDVDELLGLNAKLLHGMPFETARPRLAALGLNAVDAPLWMAIRGNLLRLRDAKDWLEVVHGEIPSVAEDQAVCAAALQSLPPEPFDETTWGSWTNTVKAATAKKGRELYHPLRLALTGRETGPELKVLLPLIGRERAERRLKANAG